jgi:hypothetical protein
MKLRIAIAITMIVGFVVTFGVLTWGGRDRDHTPAVQSPRAAAKLEPVNPAVRPLSSDAAGPAASAPPAEISRQTPALAEAPAEAVPASAATAAQTELPVQFNYRRSAENPQTYDITLVNKIDEPVTLDMTILNPASGQASNAQITLESSEAKKVGVDDGLEIEVGDQITLRNPAYNAMVAEIRQR